MTPIRSAAPARKGADQSHEDLTRRYAAVARQPAGQFPYPTGRVSAERLGYRRDLLDFMPRAVVERFVGVGNPFSLGLAQPGWNILDIGCGAGFESQVAARCARPEGRVIGVDLSEEMLAAARQGLAQAGLGNIEFRRGRAEQLPVESGWAAVSRPSISCWSANCRPSWRTTSSPGRTESAAPSRVGPTWKGYARRGWSMPSWSAAAATAPPLHRGHARPRPQAVRRAGADHALFPALHRPGKLGTRGAACAHMLRQHGEVHLQQDRPVLQQGFGLGVRPQ
jgi:SAM-dependent methyltransferase